LNFKMSKLDTFYDELKFCNPVQLTMGWWVKWVGSLTQIIFLFIFKYSNI